MKIFLGGTCNESTWRDELIKMLDPEIECFNPVVDDWTLECQAEEERQKKICNFNLFVITSEMTGVFLIAEVIDCSNKFPQKTIFCYLEEGFTEGQIKSLHAVGKMVNHNGAWFIGSLGSVSAMLNNINKLGKK